MKPPKFKSVDECLNWIPEDERVLTIELRNLVLDCMPNCNEKLSYNVPYFHGNRAICFIWPASVLWGNRKTYEGVRLGFTRGSELDNRSGFLDQGGRKHVFWVDFEDVKMFQKFFDLTRDFIFEAYSLDQNR